MLILKLFSLVAPTRIASAGGRWRQGIFFSPRIARGQRSLEVSKDRGSSMRTAKRSCAGPIACSTRTDRRAASGLYIVQLVTPMLSAASRLNPVSRLDNLDVAR